MVRYLILSKESRKMISKGYTLFGESEILKNYNSCNCRCKLTDSQRYNSKEKWEKKCQGECKNLIKQQLCKKDYILNSSTYSREISKALLVIQ